MPQVSELAATSSLHMFKLWVQREAKLSARETQRECNVKKGVCEKRNVRKQVQEHMGVCEATDACEWCEMYKFGAVSARAVFFCKQQGVK